MVNSISGREVCLLNELIYELVPEENVRSELTCNDRSLVGQVFTLIHFTLAFASDHSVEIIPDIDSSANDQ